MNIVSRKAAKAVGLTRYFTGKPCIRGHIHERHTSNGMCVVCHRQLHKIKRMPGGALRAYRIRHIKARRRKNFQNWKIQFNLRRRLHHAVKGDYRTGSAVRDLGCSIGDFKVHIAAKFVDGMTWDNYGAWHLDHIRPLASFDLADRGQFLEACHFSNYQPLWAADNIAKGATW